MSDEFVSTLQATEIFGRPRAYWVIHHYIRRGQLLPVELSPRKFFFKRADVERLARQRRKFMGKQ